MSEPAESADAPANPDPNEIASRIGELYAACVQAGNAGANWFFWIAALSLVNTAMAHGGGDRHFIIGLSITAIVDGIAQEIGKQQPQAASLAMGIAIGFSICTAVVVVLVGWLSRKRLLWVFGIGMGLYLLDGLAYLAFGDFLSAGFHAYALFSMSRGFNAYRQMTKLETALEAEPASVAADDDE
ncbi:MAG: hypothetical protein DWI21_08940 [Planctomycetota bacterium]|nr:MAG: hypothetical protein DWI21_08940 [Planctomycetota bacterium]